MIDSKRVKTMRNRLGNASELIDNDSYLPRARRVQMDCTKDEFDAICKLARRADNPQHYFMRSIAKDRIESTIGYVRRILSRSVSVITYITKRLQSKSSSWITYVADMITKGGYSMSDVVNMVDLSINKKHPDRYLVGILKKGYSSGQL